MILPSPDNNADRSQVDRMKSTSAATSADRLRMDTARRSNLTCNDGYIHGRPLELHLRLYVRYFLSNITVPQPSKSAKVALNVYNVLPVIYLANRTSCSNHPQQSRGSTAHLGEIPGQIQKRYKRLRTHRAFVANVQPRSRPPVTTSAHNTSELYRSVEKKLLQITLPTRHAGTVVTLDHDETVQTALQRMPLTS